MSFQAGDLTISMGRAVKVLGPPESKPLQVYGEDNKPFMEDRLALPVEAIPPREDAPDGGEWIDESCFAHLPRFAPVSEAGAVR